MSLLNSILDTTIKNTSATIGAYVPVPVVAEKPAKRTTSYRDAPEQSVKGMVNIHDCRRMDDALRRSGLADWHVRLNPNQTTVNGVTYPVESQSVIRDTDDGIAVLTRGGKSVSENFHCIQNEEIFSGMDEVFSGENLQYAHAGFQGNGERVNMVLQGESISVNSGDEIERGLVVSTSHDGSGAILIGPLSRRLTCENAISGEIRAALSGKNRALLRIRHTSNARTKLEKAKCALGLIHQAENTFAEKAHYLASQRCANSTAYFASVLDSILDTTIADVRLTSRTIANGAALDAIIQATSADYEQREKAEKSYQRAVNRRDKWLAGMEERRQWEDNHTPQSAGSAWNNYNAVTGAVQHGDLLHYQGTEKQRADNSFNSQVNGQLADIGQTALELAIEYAQAN